jgi:hypothetical protein
MAPLRSVCRYWRNGADGVAPLPNDVAKLVDARWLRALNGGDLYKTTCDALRGDAFDVALELADKLYWDRPRFTEVLRLVASKGLKFVYDRFEVLMPIFQALDSYALATAVECNQVQFVRHLVDKNKNTSLSAGIERAAALNNVDMFTYLTSKDNPANVDLWLRRAAQNGRPHLVQHVLAQNLPITRNQARYAALHCVRGQNDVQGALDVFKACNALLPEDHALFARILSLQASAL